MKLDYLRGKNILELILEFPKLEWSLIDDDGKVKRDVKLDSLIFVYYEREDRGEKVDFYGHLDVTKGLSMEDLLFIREEEDRTMGLISKVKLGHSFERYECKHAHIPMIDFDTHEKFEDMDEKELVNLIVKNIKEITLLPHGVILKSGQKRNYHFYGLEYLLSDTNFVSFIGYAMTMKSRGPKDGKFVNLADERGLGHSLTPMTYMASEFEERDISKFEKVDPNSPHGWMNRYSYFDRFSTLRVNRKPDYKGYPKVVEVF